MHYREFAEILLKHRPKDDSEIEREAQRLKDVDYSIHYHVFLEEDLIALLEYGKVQ
jgi:hypothetical protein